MAQSTAQTLGYIAVGALAAYVLLPSLLPAPQEKRLKRYTTGLVNTGNDCYANATFQGLASLSLFQRYLSDAHQDGELNAWTQTLKEFIGRLAQEDSATPYTTSVWPVLRVLESLYASRMSRGQQDAHEMLAYVIDGLEQERKGASMPGNTEDQAHTGTDLPFVGTLTDTITCQRCKHSKQKHTDFTILERNPDEDVLSPQTEFISDYVCSECGPTPTTIMKTNEITRVPDILIVHINRSSFNNASFRSSRAAKMPLEIGDLRLNAVVYHSGNHYRGHYTAARRKKRPQKGHKQWWRISDDRIDEGTTKQVLDRTKDAYLLFYERAPRSPRAPSNVAIAAEAAMVRAEPRT